MDSLQITQIHVPVGNDIWRVKNQLLHFNFKQFGIDAIGNFLSVYTDYQINPVFDKKLFDRVVIKYDTAVNKKTRAYWDTVRPVPLEPEEKKDYHIKDSLFEAQKDSLLSQSNIDTLKKRQGPLKPCIFSGRESKEPVTAEPISTAGVLNRWARDWNIIPPRAWY